MWFHGVHAPLRQSCLGVCVCAHACICVIMSDCARVRVDARLSPAEEAEVEGERRVSFDKSGQIRGTET